jgi:hypothetical protein
MAERGEAELLLTYAELAARLGISADGARTRAKRAGWPVVIGNDGRAKVRVAAAELPEQAPVKAEHEPDMTDLLTELRRSRAERLAELSGRAERAEQEAGRWRAAAEQARSEAGQARSEAERERAVNGLLREQLERELARGERLEAELRRPWWRKLWG